MFKQVKHCSSCGEDHEVEFNTLVVPAFVGGEAYQFVGQCPNTKQPIFMKEGNELVPE